MIKRNFMKAFKINDLNIPSRIFFAPINTGYSKNGSADDRLLQFYNLRSGKGIGISYVGNVAIGKEYVTNDNNVYFSNNNDMLKLLAEKIFQNGSIPGIQLGCRFSSIMPIKEKRNTNIQGYINESITEICSYSTDKISDIINDYIEKSIMAYKLGFQVIQIHAAHGYFLSLLLSDTFNCRKDIYGRDRTLAIREIISKVKEREPGLILDLRISLLEGINSKNEELLYKSSIISKLVDTEVDIISISNGIYNINKDMIYPPKSWGSNVYLNYGIYFSKKYPNKVWNICGNIDDFYEIDKTDAENLTFSIGRLLLSDPYALDKASRFEDDKIKKCSGCNRCHYYSQSQDSLTQCI